MPITLDGTNGITTPTYGGADTSEYLVPVTQFKNRIINGAMVIDQRNAGASVSAGNAYTLDRWVVRTDTGTGNTTQQSTTAPTGYKNSLIVTVGTGATPASSSRNYIQQVIEGFNCADLAWGTASASTVTLSFWVRSSLTGTFGGALQNSAGDRSYPFTYVINSANTFEYKTVTIAGDTTGTWLTTNGAGILLYIGLGNGSTFNGTAGAWAAADYRSATGATSVVGTNGATFYITGVQLEVGSTATSFDYRPYTTELQLCQRYYFRVTSQTTYAPIGVGRAWGSSTGNATYFLPVQLRASPTLAVSNLSHIDVVSLGSPNSISNDGATLQAVKVGWNKSGATTGNIYQLEFGNGTGYWLDFSAEL